MLGLAFRVSLLYYSGRSKAFFVESIGKFREAGYEAKELMPLGYVYPSYGYTDEKVYLFAAICSDKINESLEPLEVIESDLYTFDEVDKMVDDGRISLGNAILCWIRYKKRFLS